MRNRFIKTYTQAKYTYRLTSYARANNPECQNRELDALPSLREMQSGDGRHHFERSHAFGVHSRFWFRSPGVHGPPGLAR